MNTETTTVLCSREATVISEGATDFGFRDQKGRAVGYKWTVCRVKYVPLPEGAKSGYRLPIGQSREFFEVTTSPTRDSNRYGPAFNRAEAMTEEAIDAIIRKRTEQARKRDAKKFT